MRILPPRMLPIEVWNLPVHGRPLQAWRPDSAFPAALATMVHDICARPPSHWAVQAQEQVRAVSHVYLTGGGATAACGEALASCGLTSTLSHDPVFAAARAGLTLVAADPVVCADVGQTSVKLAVDKRAWRVERDLVRAPMRDDVPRADRAAARETTIAFLAQTLASTLAPALRARATAVLALPCELTDQGEPTGCSYCWTDPDVQLLPELARLSGFALDSLHVLNDAELAAVAAERDPQLPQRGTILVLTVGFGVGGALLQRDA